MSQMIPEEIIRRNHDIHTHSYFSDDGYHSVEDLVKFCSRWQETELWIGISDHSTYLEKVLAIEYPEISKDELANLARKIRCSSLKDYQIINNKINEGILKYWNQLSRIKSKIESNHKVKLLLGIEMEWFNDGILIPEKSLKQFDYVLMAYHGRYFSNPDDAENFLIEMISHPCTDIIAHPDSFLGNFDHRECNWQIIFDRMTEREILCEYNLNSPIDPEIFEIAVTRSGLKFVITSDIHDFREYSTRRLMDAWSESCAGGFQIAFEYLQNILSQCYLKSELDELLDLFSSPEKLALIEKKIYSYSRGNQISSIIFNEREKKLFHGLNTIPYGYYDRNFLLNRLDRFVNVSDERIATVLPYDSFTRLIHSGRIKRST
jgi:histidinol phosphatase-like PHP family hydrolase